MIRKVLQGLHGTTMTICPGGRRRGFPGKGRGKAGFSSETAGTGIYRNGFSAYPRFYVPTARCARVFAGLLHGFDMFQLIPAGVQRRLTTFQFKIIIYFQKRYYMLCSSDKI